MLRTVSFCVHDNDAQTNHFALCTIVQGKDKAVRTLHNEQKYCGTCTYMHGTYTVITIATQGTSNETSRQKVPILEGG